MTCLIEKKDILVPRNFSLEGLA